KAVGRAKARVQDPDEGRVHPHPIDPLQREDRRVLTGEVVWVLPAVHAQLLRGPIVRDLNLPRIFTPYAPNRPALSAVLRQTVTRRKIEPGNSRDMPRSQEAAADTGARVAIK